MRKALIESSATFSPMLSRALRLSASFTHWYAGVARRTGGAALTKKASSRGRPAIIDKASIIMRHRGDIGAAMSAVRRGGHRRDQADHGGQNARILRHAASSERVPACDGEQ